MNAKNFSFIILILFVVLVSATLFFTRFTDEDGGISANRNQSEWAELGFFPFKQARDLANVELKTLTGDATTLAAASNQWQLVNFGYMFCPDICPINLRLLSDIKKEWAAGSDGELTVTHITFDPARDTPDRLAKYLDYINPDFLGLTGELADIRTVAQQLNTVFIYEQPDEYGNYFITHSDNIALLNPNGQYVGLFKAPYNKKNMLRVLQGIIH